MIQQCMSNSRTSAQHAACCRLQYGVHVQALLVASPRQSHNWFSCHLLLRLGILACQDHANLVTALHPLTEGRMAAD